MTPRPRFPGPFSLFTAFFLPPFVLGIYLKALQLFRGPLAFDFLREGPGGAVNETLQCVLEIEKINFFIFVAFFPNLGLYVLLFLPLFFYFIHKT